MTARKSLPAVLRRYLAARFLGVVANHMLGVALGWQMYDLTGSAWQLGLVGLAQFAPAVALAVPAGWVVDAFDRRCVLAASLALQAGAGVLLCWSSAGGWISHQWILAVCVLIGAARALQLPAQQAIIPSLVAVGELPRALAQNASMNKMAMIGGPALGGVLYAGGAGVAYGACAALFLVSTILALRVPMAAHARSGAAVSLGSLFAGFHFIWRDKVVLGAMSLDMVATLLGGSTALLPMFAKDILHTGAWGLGLLRAAPAAGGLLMTMLMGRWPLEHRVGRRMFGSVFLFGVATIAFAEARTLPLALAALAGLGAADIVSTVLRHSLVQVETPDGLRGRVAAVHAASITSSNQLGQFRAGAVAEALGPTGAVMLGGAATLALALAWSRMFPSLRRRDCLFDAAPKVAETV